MAQGLQVQAIGISVVTVINREVDAMRVVDRRLVIEKRSDHGATVAFGDCGKLHCFRLIGAVNAACGHHIDRVIGKGVA